MKEELLNFTMERYWDGGQWHWRFSIGSKKKKSQYFSDIFSILHMGLWYFWSSIYNIEISWTPFNVTLDSTKRIVELNQHKLSMKTKHFKQAFFFFFAGLLYCFTSCTYFCFLDSVYSILHASLHSYDSPDTLQKIMFWFIHIHSSLYF